MVKKITSTLFVLFLFFKCYSQVDSMYTLNFNFNDHKIKEADNKVIIKPSHIYLTDDRFGNKESAIYLQGSAESYLNLGTSSLLKATKTTISLWVKLERRMYIGKGYDFNPLYIVKNSDRSDFYVAYGIGYDGYTNRFGSSSAIDSIQEAVVQSKNYATFGQWHHFVLTSDDHYFCFYIDGELEGQVKKGFETVFLESDSVVIGHSANKKNFRYSLGSFDDIQIFHRVLNANEVNELYHAPNPDRQTILLALIAKIALIIFGILVVAFLLVANRRRSLKRERERFETRSKMSEMEMRVVKAQINPHFMSNCLAAVQHLIINNKLQAANDYLAKFGYLVRQVLNFSTRSLVTLKEELELVRLNIDLEQLRFDDKFIFNLKVDPTLNPEEILIPPLICQPLIENAIWHGLLPLKNKRPGVLTMKVKQDSESLVIIIEDNGVGRKKNKVEIGNSKDSKGLKITSQRITNLNDLYHTSVSKINDEDLSNENGEAAGTRITICLPINLVFDSND